MMTRFTLPAVKEELPDPVVGADVKVPGVTGR
jgi:hypothetical protein